MEGSPIVEYIEGSEWKYFQFPVLDRRGLYFRLSRIRNQGDPDLYVSNIVQRPNFTHSEWRSINVGDDLLHIPITDPKYKAPSWYYIGVYGWQSSLFTVRASYEDGHVLLVPGQSTTGGMTVAGKLNYYRFKMPTLRSVQDQIEIFASAMTGRVIIYSSSTNEFPNEQNHERKGVFNGNSISIVYENPIADRVYYISVFAEEPSTYSIIATISTHYIRLEEGISNYYLISNDKRYFAFETNSINQDISISLHTIAGKIDLFVNNGFEPSRTNYTWNTTSTTYMGSEITIPVGDPRRNPKGDKFYIVAYGTTGYNYFSINAYSSNTSALISDGQVITGQVALNKYLYYAYYVRNPGKLTISLKALLTRGWVIADPDLYVSKRFDKPNKDQYEWYSNNYGNDVLTITVTNGWYYIAVHGAYWPYEGNIPFELRASTDYDSIALSGESIFGYVGKGEYRYYLTNVQPPIQALSVGVTLISGATELYINDNVTRPNRNAYKWGTKTWPGNVLSINTTDSSFKYGQYTYSVYGIIESEYFIHSSSITHQAYLTIGQPKIGSVKKGANYFKVKGENGIVTKQDYYLNVNLMSVNAYPPDVKVYVSQNVPFPNENQNTWTAANEGYGNIHLLLDANKVEPGKEFFINIVGNDNYESRVRLNLNIPREPLFITQDQPQEREVQVNQRGSYTVLKARESTGVQIYMESCDDEAPPKFYVSSDPYNRFPNASRNEMVSQRYGKFGEMISNSSLGHDKRYFYTATEFQTKQRTISVYATTIGDIRSTPTKPLRNLGLIDKETLRIQVPTVPRSDLDPIIYLTYVLDISGQSKEFNMETACAIMNNAELSDITVPENGETEFNVDIWVESHKRYLINVVTLNRFGVKAAFPVPLDVTLRGTNSLVFGKAILSSVNQTKYDQFVVDSLELAPGDQMVIAISPFSGDVDLYVSTTGPATRENNQYNATYAGIKLLYINQNNQRGRGPYYIGIYGYTDSLFSAVAYLIKGDAVELLDGRPQLSHIDFGRFQYFKFSLDDNSNFTISLTPVHGDPDLLVSHLVTRPNSTHYQWYSSMVGMDLLKITSTDFRYAPRKDYYIAVYGWSESIFSIAVTKEQTSETLTQNLPHGQIVEYNQMKYFKFFLTTRDDLTIDVSPFNGYNRGDPDLCISTKVERPNPTNCMWRGTLIGEDSITIETTDRNFQLGWYYIAVNGFGLKPTERLSIVMMATTSFHGETLLRDGVSRRVIQTNPQPSYEYFKFYYGYADTQNHLTFSTIQDSGNKVELFVSGQENSKPTLERHQYRGTSSSSFVQVQLPTNIQRGWYYCGVRTTSIANYTMTVSTNQVPLLLRPSSTYYYLVPHKYYKNFYIQLSDAILSKDIIIVVRAWSGDPDLYASTKPRPTVESHMWKSESYLPVDQIVIKKGEIPLGTLNLYVSVYGYSSYEDSSFFISYYQAQTGLPLLENQHVAGFVQNSEYNYYTFRLMNPGRLKITVELLSPSPSRVEMYSSTQRLPSRTDYEHRATSDGISKQSIIIPNAAATFHYIGILGSYGVNATYSIVASTEFDYLIDGSDVKETVAKNEMRYFKMNIRNGASQVLVSTTLISGETELYISNNSTNPSRNNFNWKATGFKGNSILIPMSDPQFRYGEWSFAVYGKESSNFFMNAQTTHGLLKPGTPRVALVSKPSPVYFKILVNGWVRKDVFVLVKAFDQSAIRVFADQDAEFPNEDKAKWRADSMNNMKQAILKIDGNSLQYFSQIVYVSVQSYTAEGTHKFEISYAAADEPFYLMHDYSTIYFSGTYRPTSWYEFLTDSNSNGLTLVLESCENIPADGVLYVGNSTKTFPITQSNANLISRPSNPYSLSIKSDKKFNDQLKLTYDSPRKTLYSLYGIDREDPRPNVTIFTAKLTNVANPKENKKAYAIEFSRIFSQFYPLNVQVVSMQRNGLYTNAYTACSLKNNGQLLKNLTLTNPTYEKVVIELDKDKEYYVNLVIQDSRGRESTATPIAIGISYNVASIGVSVGSILIMILVVFISIYLILGMIYKKVRYNATGINLIPNVEFWKDVPFLIGDGILLIFTCCKKSTVTTKFDPVDETPISTSTETIQEGDGKYTEIK